ncbi:MAG TPA: CotH kinase family protein, partial [Verrucomicrobiota bacterium]|nr:CotH kinase family protein [Verrucomicrobiota bacterium]
MDRVVRLAVILLVILATGGPLARGASWVTPGDVWRGWKGTGEASSPDATAWRAVDFDDQAWPEWRLPVFFGEALAGTELGDMAGEYSCIYLRRALVEAVPGEISHVRLGVVCDAGFVVWLNGRELVRQNVPDGEPGVETAAASEPPAPVAYGTYAIPVQPGWIVPGTNVLAVQVFSSGRGDDDFLFDAGFEADRDTAAPGVETVIPAPGDRLRSFTYLEVQFDEPVVGVEAADLLINGVAATHVLELAPGDFLFTFESPGDGAVTVGWREGHGIADGVADAHPFEAGTWLYVVDSTMAAPGVFLSEIMADNRKTLNDEDGESSDWIEVANPGEEPANLAGWHLTDDAGELRRWAFPDVDVPARGYLLVFASGKDRSIPTGKLHTNFKLAAEGGYVALVDPSGRVVSDFAPGYPQQWTDVSYGRALGAEDFQGYFDRPTPGQANAASGPGFAPEVEFTRGSGVFTNAFLLTLSTTPGGAVIRYTTNGTVPTAGSWAYGAPLWISNSVQIRARAFVDGLLPGPPRSETFFRLHTNLVNFTSNLPVLVLNTAGRPGATSSKLTYAHLSVYEPVKGRTTLLQPPTLLTRVGFQIRGSSTEGIAKSSYKVEVWDEFDRDRKVEVLGLPADSDWVLYAPNNFEPVMIHNPFIHQLSRDMGRYSSRTRFVELYYNRTTGPLQSNMYAGVYVLEEKVKISPDRVDLDELEPEHVQAPEVTGGYLLKIDRLDPGDTGLSVAGVRMAYVDPKEKEMKLAQWLPHRTYLRSYFTNFHGVLNSTRWLNPTNGYRMFVDVDAWIDYHVLETLSFNVDALGLSTYLHKPRSGRITFGPHWDFDRALGSTDGRDANPRVWHSGALFSAPWWGRLFTDKDFGQQWLDRWQALRGTHFSLTNLHGLIDRLANEVRAAQPREYQKWRVAPRGGTYQTEINFMKNWVSNRVNWIDSQLTRPPVLSHAGGPVSPGLAVTLTVPTNTTIYYTLDGTDPRVSQDGFAPSARVYTGPVVIQDNARIVARARDPKKKQTGGAPSNVPWSGPVAATFVVRTPPLLLTEIMYHPSKAPGDAGLASDYEYVELMNAGTAALGLVGFRLTNGVDYVFTAASGVTRLEPGERVLVVANREAFLRRYPGASGIAGEYGGRLGDASDRVTVVGPLQEPVSAVAYAALAWTAASRA